MIAFLARRSLVRSRTRSVLTILGVGVAGALLLDMTMLAHGLETSLGRVLAGMGYDLRLTPAGTLPFETDATLRDSGALAATLRRDASVRDVGRVLGATAFVARGDDARGAGTPAFLLGVEREARAIYRDVDGSDLPGLDIGRARGATVRAGAGEIAVLVNAEVARSLRVHPGDTVRLAAQPLQTLPPDRPALTGRVCGIADVRLDAAGQQTVVALLGDAQRLAGDTHDEASLLVARVAPGADADSVAARIAARHPQLSAYSLQHLLRTAAQQLSYFTQFALVLGATSVVVAAMLLGTIVTLSVRGRLGEIVTLRALGVSAARVRLLITCEAVTLTVVALPLAFALGLGVAQVLDRLLKAAPGLPSDLHFFVFTAAAAWQTIGLLLGCSVVAGAYPAHIAARQPIAATLHAEVT